MFKNLKKFKQNNDTGLSNTLSTANRYLNNDGSFNVKKEGAEIGDSFSIYYFLINLKSSNFLLLIILVYTTINFVFATLYLLIGPEHLAGIIANTKTESFWEVLFFSAQTLTTVGYGRVSPTGFLTNIVASTEALFGLMLFALVTGLLFARFSRPVQKIYWSKVALVAPYKNMTGLMFRLANAKQNQLIDCEIDINLALTVIEDNKPARRFFQLDLERKSINFLALNWTVVHPIDDNSPLSGLTKEDLKNTDMELIISLKGIDETTGQTFHTRYSYKYDEVIYNAKFKTMFTRTEDSKHTILQLNKISDHELI